VLFPQGIEIRHQVGPLYLQDFKYFLKCSKLCHVKTKGFLADHRIWYGLQNHDDLNKSQPGLIYDEAVIFKAGEMIPFVDHFETKPF
jgi:hypothetical protein